MTNGLLYERFHSGSKVSHSVINESNFTYINIIKILNKFVLAGGLDVLDLGCGVGSLSFYIASKNNKVLGVDVSERAISTANKTKKVLSNKLNVEFFKLNKNQVPAKSNSKYDLILASEVLEHLQNDELLLKKLFKLLSSKGVLIISVPSLNAPLYRLGFLKKFDTEVGHLRRYSFDIMVGKLSRHLFTVIDWYKFEGLFRNLLFTSKNFNFIVRFLKGPLSLFFNFLDKLTVKVFGESQLVFVVQKNSKK